MKVVMSDVRIPKQRDWEWRECNWDINKLNCINDVWLSTIDWKSTNNFIFGLVKNTKINKGAKRLRLIIRGEGNLVLFGLIIVGNSSFQHNDHDFDIFLKSSLVQFCDYGICLILSFLVEGFEKSLTVKAWELSTRQLELKSLLVKALELVKIIIDKSNCKKNLLILLNFMALWFLDSIDFLHQKLPLKSLRNSLTWVE